MDKRRALVVASVVIAAGIAAAPALAVSATDRKQNKQLKELAEGLEEVVASVTQLDSGLDDVAASVNELDTLLTGYVNSPEYGVVQLYFDPEGDGFEANDAVPGQLLTTADIPDDTNQATASGKLFLSVPDGTTAKPIALKAAIRSGENDGTGAADPVGGAGLMAMTAQIIGSPGTTSVGGGNPGAPASLPLTSKPNASLGGAPLYPIPDKAPRTDSNPAPLSFPDSASIELTNPATLQTITGAPGRFTVTNTSGGQAAAVVDVTVRVHDLEEDGLDIED